jgi:polyisoprenoid-binding protein YceI
MARRINAGQWTLGGVLVALLAGCAQPARAPAALPRTPATIAAAAASGAATAAAPTPAAGATATRHYRIDARRSLLTLRVLRGGTLAALGHNHVIAVRDLQGDVTLAPQLEASTVHLRIPVTLMTIDEPELRAQAGEDFAAAVPEAAREATRRNMLGVALLDAQRSPWIELEAQRIVATSGGLRLTLQVQMTGHSVVLDVPVMLQQSTAELVASGEMVLRQSDLGLVPFSVMMGALQVQDAMQLRFRVVAAAD